MRVYLLATILYFVVLIAAAVSYAGDVEIFWDQQRNPVVTHTAVYERLEGESFDFNNPVAMVPTPNNGCRLSVSEGDGLHYFTLKSYVASANVYSVETSNTISIGFKDGAVVNPTSSLGVPTLLRITAIPDVSSDQ